MKRSLKFLIIFSSRCYSDYVWLSVNPDSLEPKVSTKGLFCDQTNLGKLTSSVTEIVRVGLSELYTRETYWWIPIFLAISFFNFMIRL